MKIGVSKIDGRGRPSEDRFFINDISGEFLIAGVFDGHSGSFTVDFTLKILPRKLVELVKSVGNDEQSMRKGLQRVFIEHDKLLAQQGPIHYKDSGSTATIIIVTATQCYFAFIGDSPGFIFDPDTGAIIVSIGKHEPNREDEYKRIIKNGGSVTTEDDDVARVNGCLAVSRAFGDFSLKFENSKIPELNKTLIHDVCVTADPEIIVIPRPQKGIIVLCSDGLIDTPEGKFRKNSDVAKAIQEKIKEMGDLTKAADAVIQTQVSEFTVNPAEYDADDISLVLIDISSVPVVKGGSKVPTTRKVKARGRPKTGKRKGSLPKTFMI
jgi:serine/threonine protein phosphatase PrpC